MVCRKGAIGGPAGNICVSMYCAVLRTESSAWTNRLTYRVHVAIRASILQTTRFDEVNWTTVPRLERLEGFSQGSRARLGRCRCSDDLGRSVFTSCCTVQFGLALRSWLRDCASLCDSGPGFWNRRRCRFLLLLWFFGGFGLGFGLVILSDSLFMADCRVATIDGAVLGQGRKNRQCRDCTAGCSLWWLYG